MSTVAYAALTNARVDATPGTSTTTKPGVNTFVDSLSALVPAEVLIAHAAILSVSSETSESDGEPVTTITEPGTLRWVFWLLIVLSIGIYLLGRGGKRDRFDVLRAVIPALSFVGWTMLQKATAFDAVWPGTNDATRTAIGVLGAVILGVVASKLAYKADEQS